MRLIKISDSVDDMPFKPSKYVYRFKDAWESCAGAESLDDVPDELKSVVELYDMQTRKVAEEYAEVLEADGDILSMSQNEAMGLLGELADLVQATMQKMYMVGCAKNVSVPQMIAMTQLKCLTRDKGFYTQEGSGVR